jgi:uncharacterized protein YndB with AHSA1/START domain
VPTARRSRTIAASTEELWALVGDPHHLPRWWPRVTRVEDVQDGAFTEVMRTRKGKTVRADFNLVHSDAAKHTITWVQRVEGTPFARVLRSSETGLRLTPRAAAGSSSGEGEGWAGADATEVTIELRQALVGFFPRLGGFMVRRAAAATIDEALDGLERIHG